MNEEFIDYDAVLTWDYESPSNLKLMEIGNLVMQHYNKLHDWAFAILDEHPIEDTGLDVFLMKLRTRCEDFYTPPEMLDGRP